MRSSSPAANRPSRHVVRPVSSSRAMAVSPCSASTATIDSTGIVSRSSRSALWVVTITCTRSLASRNMSVSTPAAAGHLPVYFRERGQRQVFSRLFPSNTVC